MILELDQYFEPVNVYGKFLLCEGINDKNGTKNYKICSLASREEICFPKDELSDSFRLNERKYIAGIGILFTFNYYLSAERKLEHSCLLLEAKEQFLDNKFFCEIAIKKNLIYAKGEFYRERIFNHNGDLIIEKDRSQIKNGNGEVIYEKVKESSELILVENEKQEVAGLGIKVGPWKYEYYPL